MLWLWLRQKKLDSILLKLILLLVLQLIIAKFCDETGLELNCDNFDYEYRLRLPAPSLKTQERSWRKLQCNGTKDASPNIAIIIPYRNRSANLRDLLYHLRLLLHKQRTRYVIYIVEQIGTDLLNKASLMNIGAKEVNRDQPGVKCLIFHDVDLVPEVDTLHYGCSTNFSHVRHLSVAVSNLKYELPYESLVGGVIAFTWEQFQYVNGYSNAYWGWGGEDDDLWQRLEHHGFHIARPSTEIGRYRALLHRPSAVNTVNRRWQVLDNAHWRYYTDGLHNVLYKLLSKYYSNSVVKLRVKLLPPVIELKN